MKQISLILTLLLLTIANVNAQQTFAEWSNAEIDQANTAVNTSLSKEEQLVIFYCNLARLNGSKFLKTYAKDYLKTASSYEKTLRNDLEKTSNLPMLYPEKNLCESAKYHAEDMGIHNTIGHTSTNGNSFSTRVRSYYNGNAIAENCSYGSQNALDIVMDLLIDDGIKSVGHRKNILNPEYNAIGVAIYTHQYYRYNCVQDFGDKLIDPME